MGRIAIRVRIAAKVLAMKASMAVGNATATPVGPGSLAICAIRAITALIAPSAQIA